MAGPQQQPIKNAPKRSNTDYLNPSRSELINHYKTERKKRPPTYSPVDFLTKTFWSWIYHYFKSRFGKKFPYPSYAAPHTGIYTLEESGAQGATICIASDWATDTEDSFAIAEKIREQDPDYTIHVGDTYYVGAPHEIRSNFTDDGAPWYKGSKGSFAVLGNHEMYARGEPFFEVLLKGLGPFYNGKYAGQKAGFFCLENEHWRILGLDTGYHSTGIPILEFLPPFAPDCRFHQTQMDWLRDVVKLGDPNDKRGIVVLTHHQYISAFRKEKEYAAPAKQLASLIGTKREIIWLWGHEHKLAFYGKAALDGGVTAFGRCIGHGGTPVEIEGKSFEVKVGNAGAPHLVAVDRRQLKTVSNTALGYNGFATMHVNGSELTIAYADHQETLIRERWMADTKQGRISGSIQPEQDCPLCVEAGKDWKDAVQTSPTTQPKTNHMPKVLVTGANGFIGSHLVPLLLQKGYEVHCLVRYTSNVAALRHHNVSIHVGDLREPSSLAEPVKEATYIFHLAATLLGTTQKDFDDTNVKGTQNLLEAAAVHAPQLQRFVLVSSLAALGPNAEPVPYTEAAELKPMSWYGNSKKKAEAVAKNFSGQLPVTVVRPAIVYGEREQDLSQIYPLVENRIQPKLGLGKKLMVAVYVGDLAKGILAAAETPGAAGKTYFLNHPELITSKQIIKSIGVAMGRANGLTLGVPHVLIKATAPISELMHHFNYQRPKMTRDKAREVTQQYWLASPQRAMEELNWKPEHNLVEGMKKSLVPYFNEKKQLREMALENKVILWIKYFLVALIIGTVVETVAYYGGFYRFYPAWLVYVIVAVAFGLIFASIAFALRKKTDLTQFVVGVLAAGAIESANTAGLFGDYYWVFKEGWPFGITNAWVRTVVLALPGGVFILLLNFILRSMYKSRLKYLGDR